MSTTENGIAGFKMRWPAGHPKERRFPTADRHSEPNNHCCPSRSEISKSEYRNPKQIRIERKRKNGLASFFRFSAFPKFRICLSFVSDFGIRISDLVTSFFYFSSNPEEKRAPLLECLCSVQP